MSKLRIGVIGVCGRGRIADFWRDNPRSEVVAGADVNPAYLADFRRRMGEDVFTTDDYRELVTREDVDAVAITTPDFLHAEHAIAAMQSGKHVFLEKPLAICTEQCDEVLRTWRATGVHLMVGHNMRYMRMFRKMKEIADSGEIGEVRAVWVRHFVGMGSPFYFHDWHAQRRNTNSLLLQKGCHDIDIIHWISGSWCTRVAAFGGLDFFGGTKPNDLRCTDCPEAGTCSESVTDPRMDKCAFRREVDVEDNYVMIMELESGAKAVYTECHFSADGHRNYVFIGTKGQIENSELESKVWLKRRRHAGMLEQGMGEVFDIEIDQCTDETHGGADPVICEDFLDMILLGSTPVATPVAGRMSVAVGCAATESLRSGGTPVNVARIDWDGNLGRVRVPAASGAE